MKKKLILLFSILATIFIVAFIFFSNIKPPEKEEEPEVPSLTYNSTAFDNRVYLKNGKLVGDETTHFGDKEVKLTASMISKFDTSTIGKKIAQVTYGKQKKMVSYYVVESEEDKSLNCLSGLNNLFTTYYVNEELNLSDTTIDFYEVVDNYMTKETIPVSLDMISGFDNASVGIKTLQINHKDNSYKFTYYVKNRQTDKITANSFTKGNYYGADFSEETEHFKINIHEGSYLSAEYKTVIEKMYKIQEEITGLEFADKITIEVYKEYHPSCGGLTIYINASSLFAAPSNAFQHELAHALNHSQVMGQLPTRTLTEGFATYIEYLTSKKIREKYPELISYTTTHYGVISNNKFLSNDMYLYDFEDRILNLKQDELAPNSPYEAGGRFFAYLDHRYGDFCGWLKNESFAGVGLSEWKELLKDYYDNENLFNEFYSYEQSLLDKSNLYCGADNFSSYGSVYAPKDFSFANQFNFYFNFSNKKDYQGKQAFIYKDLYINIESAKDQLTKSGIAYSDIKMRTQKNITIELYNALGELIDRKTNTSTEFSVNGVSFVKLVGSGVETIDITY